MRTLQISIVAYTVQSSTLLSGFNTFRIREEEGEFRPIVALSSVLTYSPSKNNLGSHNSTLVYGLNSLMSSRPNVSVSLEFHKQTNMRLFALVAPPAEIRGSVYVFALEDDCAEGEVLQNFNVYKERQVRCEKQCTTATYLFEEMNPKACIECDQFGANFTYNELTQTCECDPHKAYIVNGSCICKDHGYISFETGRECEKCFILGCLYCFQMTCESCLEDFTLTTLENSTKVCEVNCTAISHATVRTSPTECGCQPHFFWNSADFICELNCASVSMSNGRAQNKSNECNCVSGVWDHTTFECRFDCSSVAFADKTKTAASFSQCPCLARFYYDSIRRECLINCSLVENSNGTDLSAVNACGCLPRFVYNPSTSSCDVNCALVPHSDKRASSKGKCSCLENFYFNADKFKCMLDCSKIQNSLGPVSERFLKCRCKNNCKWDPIMMTCELRCDWVHSSDKQQPIRNQCRCLNPTKWNSDKMSCL